MTLPATKDVDGRPIILEVYRGDTFRRTLTFLTDNDPYPLPTSGWSAQIRATPDASSSLGEFTIDASDGALGEIELSLSATQTRTLSNGWFDLQVIGADTTTYLIGRIVFSEDVTR